MTKKTGYKNLLKSLKQNYWISATIVLAILLLVSTSTNSCTGAVVSLETAGANVLKFASEQGVEAEIVSVSEGDSLYEVILLINEQEAPVYVTKDGKTLVPQPIPLTEEQKETSETATTATTEEIPTSENPSSELYIWSYCPYGVTALTPFTEVAKLLGGDFKVFLYYAGHGDFEVQQNKIQACIQELGYTTEYWNYAETFATEIYEECYGDANCDLEKSTTLMNSLGIDSAAVFSCVETSGETLLEEHYNAAKKASVTGSPTLVINGIKASVSRTAEAYKQAVCSAYETAPTACDETLDSTAATTTGSC
jgi:glutaredoxin